MNPISESECGVMRKRVATLFRTRGVRSRGVLWRVSVAVLFCVCFCGVASAAMRSPLLEEGGVSAVFVSDADRVAYDTPLVGTLEIICRVQDEAHLPDLRDRFRGFSVIEDFEAGRSETNGRARAVWRFRLTPKGVGPWRLMPFVLRLRDRRSGELSEVLTRAIDFPAPVPLPEATGAPECALEPEWVAPGWRTFGFWGLVAAGAVVLVVLCLPLLRRARRALHERTLSPEERARLELARLLGQGLLAQGQFKRFYFELTGVVRRYFERGYALRATRQTTPEFLASLAADSRFGEAERAALSDFLSAADRVKFAGVAATPSEAEAAATLARTTIESDAAVRKARMSEAVTAR